MEIKIALAGNPNCGKTTLFNALTGSNQFVGNWPGVTVEKKEGQLKDDKNVIITDLPGIYSLSPYTLEEVVARNYLIQERPSAILNIIDGTNIERNLYLTTQLVELGIPVVVAINMMDVVRCPLQKVRVFRRLYGLQLKPPKKANLLSHVTASAVAQNTLLPTLRNAYFMMFPKSSSDGTLSRFLSVTKRSWSR
jgi:small GTP-binding protein